MQNFSIFFNWFSLNIVFKCNIIEAFQLFLSDMNGGVSLQTSVTFKRFELECWDWSQIKDFLKETTPDP